MPQGQAVPTSMRHVACEQPGPPQVMVLVTGPVPVPGPGEVLIEVTHAGVNRPDCAQRSGMYPPPPDASPVLGLEVSGRIAACGPEVVGWDPGDEVCALTPGGGYAQYVTTPAAFCLPIPESLTLAEAASLPETYFTVWNNVFDRGRLAPGETLLVHGGSGGIGLTAIQLAKQFGATVITTVGTPAKAALCRDLGADHVINYREADFVAEVARITGRRGVDVILDMIGGDYIQRNLRCLAVEGRLVFIAFGHGSKVEVDWMPIMMKRLTVTGTTLRASPTGRKAQIAAALKAQVWPLLASGAVVPVVTHTFDLDSVVAAHELMESGQFMGKIVLSVGAARAS